MKSFSELIADAMHVPKDAAMDIPRVSVCGDREIYIENHKGLAEYGDTVIRIKMKNGEIRVLGRDLKIIVMKYNNIVINGEFKAVEYEKNGEKYKKC